MATLTIARPARLPRQRRTGKAAAAPKEAELQRGRTGEAEARAVKPVDGKVKLAVSLKVPDGWKMNPDAPMSYWLDSTKESGPVDRSAFGRTKLPKPVADFEVAVPVSAAGRRRGGRLAELLLLRRKGRRRLQGRRGRLHRAAHDRRRRQTRTGQTGPRDSGVAFEA